MKVLETINVSKKFRIGSTQRLSVFQSMRQRLTGQFPKRDIWALKDINFSVNSGEMVAIIGSNGSGKTTLLRIIAGIISATSGVVNVKGEVSCLFELGLGFNPVFTALDNVYLYGALQGYSKKEIDKKLPAIIEFAELEGFMGAALGDFSSGMKARLAFATVVQTVRGIILVDEVLTVGDAAFQKKCIRAFEKILSEGNTILFVSHGIGEAKKICTSALYIEKGEQIGYGSVEEMEALYEKKGEKKQ